MSEPVTKPSMTLTVNGEVRELPHGTTLSELIEFLSLAPERLAVERNLEVVRRTEWSVTKLAEGDRIEVVHFVGGGSRYL